MQAAAPATWTATSAAGTPVKYCVVPTAAWPHTSASSTPSRTSTARGACDRQQPEAQADQQGEVCDQQRRMHVHQGVDLDFETRHRPARAPVARVWSGRGHQRARHQNCSQVQRGQRRQRAQWPGHPLPHHSIVGLADLDVEQHRQPHHRHRCQQVDGHGPPQQPGAHGDAADHRLHDRRHRHQPRIDQDLGAPARTADDQYGQHRGDHHRECDHPVAEFDRLVDARDLGDSYRCEAAGKTLWPGGATQARRGDADDRAGNGDPTLGEDHDRGDDPLDAQADGHRPIVGMRRDINHAGPRRRVVCVVYVSRAGGRANLR